MILLQNVGEYGINLMGGDEMEDILKEKSGNMAETISKWRETQVEQDTLIEGINEKRQAKIADIRRKRVMETKKKVVPEKKPVPVAKKKEPEKKPATPPVKKKEPEKKEPETKKPGIRKRPGK